MASATPAAAAVDVVRSLEIRRATDCATGMDTEAAAQRLLAGPLDTFGTRMSAGVMLTDAHDIWLLCDDTHEWDAAGRLVVGFMHARVKVTPAEAGIDPESLFGVPTGNVLEVYRFEIFREHRRNGYGAAFAHLLEMEFNNPCGARWNAVMLQAVGAAAMPFWLKATPDLVIKNILTPAMHLPSRDAPWEVRRAAFEKRLRSACFHGDDADMMLHLARALEALWVDNKDNYCTFEEQQACMLAALREWVNEQVEGCTKAYAPRPAAGAGAGATPDAEASAAPAAKRARRAPKADEEDEE